MGLHLPQSDASPRTFGLEVSKVRKHAPSEVWHFGARGCKNVWHLKVAAFPSGSCQGDISFLQGGVGQQQQSQSVRIVSSSGQFYSVVLSFIPEISLKPLL